jgi:hypothetical protein
MMLVNLKSRKTVSRLAKTLACTAAVGALCAFSQAANASETRGYVISWWHIATSMEGGDDCPQGVNPNAQQVFVRILREQGFPPAEIEKRLIEHQEKGPAGGGYGKIMPMRGKDKDGNPVNVYQFPESAKDPNLKRSQSKIAYGFNLDGVNSPDDFTDPETKETGVDNAFYRATGCIDSFRATAGVSRPNVPGFMWEVTREHTPAWLVEVSGIDDYKNDDEVYVSFLQATLPATKDAAMEVRKNMTMFVDKGSRMNAKIRGHIKDGLLVTDKADEVHLIPDPYVMPGYDFRDAKVRVKFNEDGTIRGIFGGYLNWLSVYWGSGGSNGSTWEYSQGADLPGMYYAIKKSADADPDPKTGQNREISASYWFDAVPAFVVHPDDNAKVAGATK